MIKINKLTVKNFMSVGNATQGIDFDDEVYYNIEQHLLKNDTN